MSRRRMKCEQGRERERRQKRREEWKRGQKRRRNTRMEARMRQSQWMFVSDGPTTDVLAEKKNG